MKLLRILARFKKIMKLARSFFPDRNTIYFGHHNNKIEIWEYQNIFGLVGLLIGWMLFSFFVRRLTRVAKLDEGMTTLAFGDSFLTQGLSKQLEADAL